MLHFLKQCPIDQNRRAADHQIDDKRQLRMPGDQTAGAEKEHHRRVNQRIQGIHSQQAGRDNLVLNQSLKDNRSTADAEGGYKHHQQFRHAQLHRIGSIFRIDVDRQIADHRQHSQAD